MATTTPDVQRPPRQYTNLEHALWSKAFARDLSAFWGDDRSAAAFIAEIFNQARHVPRLHQCTIDSIQLNVARIAALRLNPALPNMVAFIPRTEEGRLNLTVQFGYAGLRELVMRHPDVKDAFTRAVCVNDHFAPPATLTGPPEHRLPGGFQPRGRVIGYFAVIELVNGNWRFWSMSVSEIEAHIKRYIPKPGPAWSQANRPEEDGLTARDKMSMKTCLRMLCNGRDVPMTAEAREALAVEAAEEAVPTAAELQGYDRQGNRPALTESTGVTLGELLQDVAGVQDKVAVEAYMREETRPRARQAPPQEEARAAIPPETAQDAPQSTNAPQEVVGEQGRRRGHRDAPRAPQGIWREQLASLAADLRARLDEGQVNGGLAQRTKDATQKAERLAGDPEATDDDGWSALKALQGLAAEIEGQTSLL
jgi:recombinational DNA repair protein RecT